MGEVILGKPSTKTQYVKKLSKKDRFYQNDRPLGCKILTRITKKGLRIRNGRISPENNCDKADIASAKSAAKKSSPNTISICPTGPTGD